MNEGNCKCKEKRSRLRTESVIGKKSVKPAVKSDQREGNRIRIVLQEPREARGDQMFLFVHLL